MKHIGTVDEGNILVSISREELLMMASINQSHDDIMKFYNGTTKEMAISDSYGEATKIVSDSGKMEKELNALIKAAQDLIDAQGNLDKKPE